MKILIIYSNLKCACTRKGTFELQKALSKFSTTDVLPYFKLDDHTYKKYDVVIFQRLGGNGLTIPPRLINYYKGLTEKYRGKVLSVYNIDDLILYDPVKVFMKMVDMVIVPNKTYDSYVFEFNSNIRHYRAFADMEYLEAIESNIKLPPNKINVIWASTGALGLSFMNKLIPILNTEIPEVRIYCLSGQPGNIPDSENLMKLPILKLDEYIQLFKKCQLCFNPIELEEPFFRGTPSQDFINAKSPIKYLNAGICKVPILSSKSYPYERAITNEVNGILLDNDVAQWITAIRKISSEPYFRKDIIDNAYIDVKRHHNLDRVASDLYNFFKKEIM